MKKILLTTLAVAFQLGCTTPYTPRVYPTLDAIPEFSGSTAIAITNGQPSTEPMPYASQGARTWTADLHEWTDVAIALTEREVVERGFTVAEGSERALELSVETASLEIGWAVSNAEVTMRATTSDGTSAVYVGVNESGRPINLIGLADGALMRAVAAMLSDEKIVAFLTP